MNLTVLLFGDLKKRINADRLIISTDLPILSSDLLKLIETLKPELNSILKYCSIACNGNLVGSQTLIYQKDEVALLPPVSGG